MNREDAARALAGTDWSSAEVEREKRPMTAVFSTRLTGELADWVASEADRRGVRPGVVIRDAVAAARRAAQEEDKTVTLNLRDLHRVIETLADPAA
jgi:hypothetical protein